MTPTTSGQGTSTGDERLAPTATRRSVPDRVRRRQRQQSRLRRTVAAAVVLLLVGTVLARWREDPGTVLAAGVAAPRSSDGSDRPASNLEAGRAETRVAPGSAATDVGHADVDDTSQGMPADSSAAVPAPVPASGSGHLTAVAIPPGSVKQSGRAVTYGIDIEDGLPVGAAEFAAVVHAVLVDDRGWQTQDGVRFVPLSPDERAAGAHVDITVTLASPTLTASLCAPLDTAVQQVSCWNGSRSVLNLTRWVRGAVTYGTDLTSYREYLVSHEVGHGLGHAHASCPAAGTPAPVMVQQTKDLEGCTAWPWPTRP